MIESSARNILELSNDDLARVTGGRVIVEDGKEQYPGNIGSLGKGRGKGKRRGRRRR